MGSGGKEMKQLCWRWFTTSFVCPLRKVDAFLVSGCEPVRVNPQTILEKFLLPKGK